MIRETGRDLNRILYPHLHAHNAQRANNYEIIPMEYLMTKVPVFKDDEAYLYGFESSAAQSSRANFSKDSSIKSCMFINRS